MRCVKFTPVTLKEKNRVREHGEIWEALAVQHRDRPNEVLIQCLCHGNRQMRWVPRTQLSKAERPGGTP